MSSPLPALSELPPLPLPQQELPQQELPQQELPPLPLPPLPQQELPRFPALSELPPLPALSDNEVEPAYGKKPAHGDSPELPPLPALSDSVREPAYGQKPAHGETPLPVLQTDERASASSGWASASSGRVREPAHGKKPTHGKLDACYKNQPAAAAVQKMFASLPENTRQLIVRNLQRSILSNENVARVGSLFTGSNVEAPIFAEALTDVFAKAGAIGLRFRHRYACEQNCRKQRFLVDVSKPDFLFQDVGELSGRTARDVYTGQEVEIPEVDIGLAGFVCKTLSTLNRGTTCERRS